MILTCPNCASRYVVDDAHLSAGGRMVRCSHCKTAWKAEATPEPLELRRAEVKELTEPARAADLPGEALPKHYRAKVQAQAESRQAAFAGVVWGRWPRSWPGLFVLAVVFPQRGGAGLAQDRLVYAAMGMKVNVVGLVIENQTARAHRRHGPPAVRVTGVVRNVTDEAVRPPPLRVDLVDKGDDPLVSRTLDLAARRSRRAGAPFAVTFYDPPPRRTGRSRPS
jgi:predicted Zn finger-like uncharacterized protein